MTFEKILVALDNSVYSDHAQEAALTIAGALGSEVTGCHVYAARLHESRFMDMEAGLPARYRSAAVLNRQRDIHADLIEKGLGVIADSYLDRFEAGAKRVSVRTRRRQREGKNYIELIKEAGEGGYDLVVMGGFGKGVVETSIIGGVCERVVRGIENDVLVLKTRSLEGTIMVGIDGSPPSFAALDSALTLAGVFGSRVEAVAVFDPYFHQVAFRNIAGALSEEASKVFRFREQERLHDEIIDRGLAKLYQSYLDRAYRFAKELKGVEIKTTLLAGKAFNEMLKAAYKSTPSIIAVGRFGLHRVPGSSMGNTAENILRLANTNVFVSGREVSVSCDGDGTGRGFEWTEGARKRLERIPDFVRGMAKKAIEDHALEKGCTEITDAIVDEVKRRFGM